MSPPRLIDGVGVRAELLKAAQQVPSFDPRARSHIRARLANSAAPRAGQSRRLVLALAAAVALGVVVAKRLSMPPEPEVTASAGAVLRHHDQDFSLDSGRVEIITSSPLRVSTPQVEVFIAKGRVAVLVDQAQTTVEVFEGSTEVRRERQAVWLSPGEHVDSTDTRLAESSLQDLDTPPAAPCDTAECLEQAEHGEGVAAQTSQLRAALDALRTRQWARAERLASTSLERFTSGIFEPELHLVRLEALHHLGKPREAKAEGRWYLDHAPSAPNAASVALVVADLELSTGSSTEAKQAYERAMQLQPDDSTRQEGWLGVGLAELRAGHSAEARRAFEQALQAAPQGPRASELRRRLSP